MGWVSSTLESGLSSTPESGLNLSDNFFFQKLNILVKDESKRVLAQRIELQTRESLTNLNLYCPFCSSDTNRVRGEGKVSFPPVNSECKSIYGKLFVS